VNIGAGPQSSQANLRLRVVKEPQQRISSPANAQSADGAGHCHPIGLVLGFEHALDCGYALEESAEMAHVDQGGRRFCPDPRVGVPKGVADRHHDCLTAQPSRPNGSPPDLGNRMPSEFDDLVGIP
jgi:hypothetical protein